MEPIYVFAKWQVREGALQTVLDLLPELIQYTKNEEGNVCYHIYQSHTDTHTLLLYEGYEDEASLDAHRSSNHFKEIVVKQIVPLLEKREVHPASEFKNTR